MMVGIFAFPSGFYTGLNKMDNPILNQIIETEFIRLPAPGTLCKVSGLSRTGLYNECVPCKANDFRPPVPAKSLRKRGNTRGVWLIPKNKLLAFINALPETR
jgi:hypothetical protein